MIILSAKISSYSDHRNWQSHKELEGRLTSSEIFHFKSPWPTPSTVHLGFFLFILHKRNFWTWVFQFFAIHNFWRKTYVEEPNLNRNSAQDTWKSVCLSVCCFNVLAGKISSLNKKRTSEVLNLPKPIAFGLKGSYFAKIKGGGAFCMKLFYPLLERLVENCKEGEAEIRIPGVDNWSNQSLKDERVHI